MEKNKTYDKAKLMRIKDVVNLTTLSLSHLYKLTMRRDIPHMKRGKFLYFNRREILKWLKENRISPLTKPGDKDDNPGSITIE